MSSAGSNPSRRSPDLAVFGSEVVDRVRAAGNVWPRPWGELRIPRVFGFCRGVKRALAMLEYAVTAEAACGTRFVLLGQIIHNPWVNDHFRRLGVRILTERRRGRLRRHLAPEDCAVVPAFGVPLAIDREHHPIGSRIIDTTCGDVRRLWKWAEDAVGRGYGVLIYGRAMHDETIVTKSRLEAVGGKYLVVGSLHEAELFCGMLSGRAGAGGFTSAFGPETTNARTLDPFGHLAQVSQTTMLYEETMRVRDQVREAFEHRFGEEGGGRVLFQPTVCRATQDRQAAAIEMCGGGCDLVIVVGGFGSSNTRHLYELAGNYCPALFIEGSDAVVSRTVIRAFDPVLDESVEVRDWRLDCKPLRIGVLAGASSPEVVIGEVLERLVDVLG